MQLDPRSLSSCRPLTSLLFRLAVPCSHTVLGVDQSMVVLQAEVRTQLPRTWPAAELPIIAARVLHEPPRHPSRGHVARKPRHAYRKPGPCPASLQCLLPCQVEDKSDIIAASNKALDLVGVRWAPGGAGWAPDGSGRLASDNTRFGATVAGRRVA